MANFEAAVEKTLGHEGGYVNDPKDPGGETNFGISKRAYPSLDIKNLSRAHAKEIYRQDYWNQIKGDSIKSQDSAESVFDMAVNGGVSRAKSMADSAAKILGFKSFQDIPESMGKDFARVFGSLRISFYKDLVAKKPQMKKFLIGWERRAKSFFSSSPLALVAITGTLGAVAWWLLRQSKKETI